jgi:serine phosphatase RsbU (regulator of sigma subunit)
MPGVRLCYRHQRGHDGCDWYDAFVLPEGALGLTVGSVTGSGAGAAAAMGRLRASLRAYAVLEGEDPVAVLSDLEVLLHLTEPARSATALFAHVEPAERRLVLAGAGHCPPLRIGAQRAEFVETSLSAPLGMLSCWEAPSVELAMKPGETLVFFTDGLLHRAGGTLDQSFAILQAAAARAPREAREDPDLLCAHLLASCVPDAAGTAPEGEPEGVASGQGGGRVQTPVRLRETAPGDEDIVLLAVRFD